EIHPLIAILKLSGVVQSFGGLLHIRNRIYAHVFNRTWIRAMMPDAEIRRQRAAYWKGMLRATCISAVVFLAMAALTMAALNQKRRADQNSMQAQSNAATAELRERETRQTLYASNINLAQQAWEAKDFAH